MGTENTDGTQGCAYVGLVNDGLGSTPLVTDYFPGAVMLHDTTFGDTSVKVVLPSGDDIADTIPAPFKINLYGISLLQGYPITVSSNGWVTMGNDLPSSYRNNTLPDTDKGAF